MTMVTVDLANNIVGLIIGILTLAGILIGFVAWFIRLESKVNYLEKDHGENKSAQKGINESIQVTLNQVLIALGELKGKVGN